MNKNQLCVFLSINLLIIAVCEVSAQQGKADKLFAGTWKGTRVQWTNGPPDVIRWLPAKGTAPFELQVDAAERHFAGFNIRSRNGRTISGQRGVTDEGGNRWQETATLTVAADGVTAKFSSTSVMLTGWKGATIENSAELRKVR
jgi:hypothetical protein